MVSKDKGWLTWDLDRSLADSKARHHVYKLLQYASFTNEWCTSMGFPAGSLVKNTPVNAGNARDTGSIPKSGRLSGGRNGNPLQYSCLENPMDRGAWRATVWGSQRVAHGWAMEHAVCLNTTDTMVFLKRLKSQIVQLVKKPPTMQENPVRFLGQEDPLEKEQATHSSILGLPLWLRW